MRTKGIITLHYTQPQTQSNLLPTICLLIDRSCYMMGILMISENTYVKAKNQLHSYVMETRLHNRFVKLTKRQLHSMLDSASGFRSSDLDTT